MNTTLLQNRELIKKRRMYINNCGSDNFLHEVEFGRDVLKLAQEALSLDEGQGTIPFTDPRLKGLSHTETGPRELYS
jgi:hypothetical protein